MSHDRRSHGFGLLGARPPSVDLVRRASSGRSVSASCARSAYRWESENRRGLDVQIDERGVDVQELLAVRMLPIARVGAAEEPAIRLVVERPPADRVERQRGDVCGAAVCRRRGEGEARAGSAPPAGTWERRRSRRIPRRRSRTWLRRAPTLTIRLRAAKRATRRAPGVPWRRPPRSRRFPRPCSRRRPLPCAGPRPSDRATRTSRRRRALRQPVRNAVVGQPPRL